MPENIFKDKPYYNADETANAVTEDDVCNVYLEPAPDVGFTTTRRPGYTEFADLGTGVKGDGIFWWDAANALIAVSNGVTYSVGIDGSVVPLTGPTGYLEVGNTVSFAAGQSQNGTPYLYMANGALAYLTAPGEVTAPTDAAAPLEATSVAFMNNKFIANLPDSNKFYVTGTDPDTSLLDPEYWSSDYNPFSAVSKGDTLSSLFVAWEEVYAWGRESLEIFQDDGSSPFVRISGSASELGLEAPDSVVQAANTVFALCVMDGKRMVVKFEGRSPVNVSVDIEEILNSYSYVEDAVGSLISVGGIAVYLLQFPSEGKTWAYDYKHNYWVPWRSWDTTTDHNVNFIPLHATYARKWNKTLMMSRVDGKIYELSRDTTNDDGTLMLSYRRTPFIDHGSEHRRKRSEHLWVKAKSGVDDSSVLMLRWRDNGAKVWSNWIQISVSPKGKYEFVTQLNRMGIYRSRQYEIRMSDDTEMVVTSITEKATLLRN